MKKIFWNLSEYFFGAGNNDFYNKSKPIYKKIEKRHDKIVEKYSTLIDKVSKVIIRSGLTAITFLNIYNYIKTGDENPLVIVGVSELMRGWSIIIERKNIKNLEENL